MAQEHAHGTTETLHTPKPSFWPIVLAATLTLTVAGLVTHMAITLAGASLSLVVMVAWVLERFEGPALLGRTTPASTHRGQGSGVRDRSWWGLVWFITTEALFFANLIAAYLYLRVSSPDWHQAQGLHLDLLFPSVNTVILLLSGVPAYYAQRAIARGDNRGLRIGLALAALLGAIFLSGQVYEYTSIGFRPQDSISLAGFFTLTGFHGAHVLAGIGLLLFVLVLSLKGRVLAQRSFAVDVASTYWHFVDVVWVFLFTILYVFQ